MSFPRRWKSSVEVVWVPAFAGTAIENGEDRSYVISTQVEIQRDVSMDLRLRGDDKDSRGMTVETAMSSK